MQSLTEIYLASSAHSHRLKHTVYLLENILKTKDFWKSQPCEGSEQEERFEKFNFYFLFRLTWWSGQQLSGGRWTKINNKLFKNSKQTNKHWRAEWEGGMLLENMKVGNFRQCGCLQSFWFCFIITSDSEARNW